MADMAHLYVTAHGEFTSSAWVGEKGQVGVRLAFAPTISAPSMGETFTPAENGAVVPAFGTQAGTHGTLTKTWSARIGPSGSVDNCDADYQIDLAEDVWTFLNTLKGNNYSGWRWTHVKFAPIDSDGKTVGTASTYTFTTPIVGTATTLLPPQNAVAISMRANIVGRKGRGRIYFPANTALMMSADGTISGATLTSMSGAFKTLIDDLQNPPGTPDNIPIVVITSAGASTAVRPAEIRMGNQMDTIRSRRAQVPETYTSLPL